MREHSFEFGEFYSLLLFATAGMMMLAQATDLVTIFLGIETMSIAVYVLTGSWRHSPKSAEGAMKYFLIGAFATGVLLYGIALVYGAAGSTGLAEIARQAPHVVAGAAVHRRLLAHPRRARLQGRRGAVPHVGARRLRGRADAGDRASWRRRSRRPRSRALIRLVSTAFSRTVLAYGVERLGVDPARCSRC